MSDRNQNFKANRHEPSFMERGVYAPRPIPETHPELITWAQSRRSCDQHFSALLQFIRVLEDARTSLYSAKSRLGGERGTLCGNDAHQSDDKNTDDALAYERRYRYELARAEVVVARDCFAKALKLLAKQIEKEIGPGNEMGAVPVAERSLYMHDLLCAMETMGAGVKELRELNSYLDELPKFPDTIAAACRKGASQYRIFAQTLLAEANEAGVNWTDLSVNGPRKEAVRKPKRGRFLDALARELID